MQYRSAGMPYKKWPLATTLISGNGNCLSFTYRDERISRYHCMRSIFTLRTSKGLSKDQRTRALAESLADEIVATLSRLNTEYAKLYSAIGTRARPHVTLLGSGEIQKIHGRKSTRL